MKTLALSAAGLLVAVFAMSVSAQDARAGHSWEGSSGPYHWARTSNPFNLKLGDNVSSTWDGHLATASTDWSASSVLDTQVVTGSTNPKVCRPTAGRVEVCNAKYGSNGWLGIAQIWISGGEHITQGVVKLNDTYYNTPTYNTPAWRAFVVCQEIGHTFGLGHQDEDFDNPNLGSCMDYTSNPGTNQHPNAHDYAELESIYGHLDSITTVGANAPTALPGPATGDLNSPNEWGKLVSQSANGKAATFERDLGHGNKVLTHVYYAD